MLNVDIGDLCTHCGRDTAFGTGLFVNRIPSGTDGTLVITGGEEDVRISVTVDGYMCPDCQLVECESCGELAEDLWTIPNEMKPNDFFGKLLLPLRVCNDCIDNAIEAGDLPENFREKRREP